MNILRLLDQNVVVVRLRDGAGDIESHQTTATVAAHIQEADTETRQLLGILEERAWRAWFEVDTDINEQDRITDEAGTVYTVREITKKNYAFGVNVHLEVLLEEYNE